MLSNKPQTETLVSAISVLEDAEQVRSKARGKEESLCSLVSAACEAKPKPYGAAAASQAQPPCRDWECGL